MGDIEPPDLLGEGDLERAGDFLAGDGDRLLAGDRDRFLGAGDPLPRFGEEERPLSLSGDLDFLLRGDLDLERDLERGDLEPRRYG